MTDELREQIAELREDIAMFIAPVASHEEWGMMPDGFKKRWLAKADKILVLVDLCFPQLAKEKGYVKLVEDQTAFTTYNKASYPEGAVARNVIWQLKDQGWRKVKLE